MHDDDDAQITNLKPAQTESKMLIFITKKKGFVFIGIIGKLTCTMNLGRSTRYLRRASQCLLLWTQWTRRTIRHAIVTRRLRSSRSSRRLFRTWRVWYKASTYACKGSSKSNKSTAQASPRWKGSPRLRILRLRLFSQYKVTRMAQVDSQ